MKKEAPSFSSDNEIPRSKNASAEGFREKLEQVSEAVFTPNEKLESQLGKAAAAYNVENAIDLSGVEMWTIRQKIEALQGADPEKAKAMGQNGRKAVMEHYNWSAQAAKMVAIYDELAQSDTSQLPIS